MSQSSPPEVTLELDGGSLTIRTAEAIYRIFVTGHGGGQAALPRAAAPQAQLPAAEDDWDIPEPGPVDGAHPAPTFRPSAAKADDAYYRELSQDMYREVGSLAKRLSMSISDVKGVDVEAMDLEKAGDRLESAKDQLESVVEMTEKATMTIIEETEGIQGAIDQVRSIMSQITSTEGEEEAGGGESAADRQALVEALEAITAYVREVAEAPMEPLVEEAGAILAEMSSLPAPAAEPAPAPAPAAEPEPAPAPAPAPAGPKYSFPLELVFQTTYELCTNETVKKHLKLMWDAGEKAFNLDKVETGLNELAPAEPDEDNFLNVDLKGVLKVLFQATKVDNYRGILKKMASTSDQIFLDQFLPMEAVLNEQAAAEPPAPEPEPEPAPEPEPEPAPEAAQGGAGELAERLEALVERLKEQAGALTPPELPEDLPGLLERVLAGGEGSARVSKERISELDQTLNTVFNSVNTIMEALSFQDLSGQAIYRIVRLLTDFQVQLLAMLVSFGSKIKSKETREELSHDESEQLAQQEVDKMLGSLGLGDSAGGEGEKEDEHGPLDQDAVNSMLENMGF